MRIIDFWLSFGVSGFRLDAAPILIHEKGLESTQLQDPHQFLREIHDFVRKRSPDAVLMAEANLPLDRLGQYFDGGKEMTMLMNFMVSAHVFLALARQSAKPIHDLLESNLETPPNGIWLNFLRNLDELSVERLPPKQRDAVLQAFAPQPNMRIYNRGIRRRLAPLLDGDRRKLEMAYSLLFLMPGSPLIMYGDEIGMGDDLSLPGRDACRTPMQWSDGKNAGFSSADQLIAPIITTGHFAYTHLNVEDELKDKNSLLNSIRQMITIRKANPTIGSGPVRIVSLQKDHPNVLAQTCAVNRTDWDRPSILFIHNFSDQPVQVAVEGQSQSSALIEAMIGTGRAYRSEENDSIDIVLPPYGYLWLR